MYGLKPVPFNSEGYVEHDTCGLQTNSGTGLVNACVEMQLSGLIARMDPITASIVTALASGAAVAAKNLATDAIKDAYAGLKALIVDKYKKAGPFVEALEGDPDSKAMQEVLANQIKGVETDEDAKKGAAALTDSLVAQEKVPAIAAVIDIGKLKVGKSLLLEDIEYTGTLIRADEVETVEDFTVKNIKLGGAGSGSGVKPPK